jgi:hypothetical protein
MFCDECGAQLDDNSKFCDNCGTPVSGLPTGSKPAAGNKASGKAAALTNKAAKITNEKEALEAITQGGIKFEDIPKNLRTAKVCLSAIEHHFNDVLPNVPQKFWEDKGFCLSAIDHCRNEALPYVSKKFWENEDFCILALDFTFWAGEYVPQEMWTPEFSWKAVDVSECGLAFQYVPEELRHPHLCLFALRQDPDFWGDIMEHIPEEIQGKVEAMYDSDIEPDFDLTLSGGDDEDSDDEDSDDDDNDSAEISRAIAAAIAAAHGGTISAENRSAENGASTKSEAVSSGGKTAALTNEKEALEAVLNSGIEIKDVPENLRTVEVCVTWLKRNWATPYNEILEWIPEKNRAKVALGAANHFYGNLEGMPESLRSVKVCLAALMAAKRDNLDVNGTLKYYVPEAIREKVKKLFDSGTNPDDLPDDDGSNGSPKSETPSPDGKAVAELESIIRGATGCYKVKDYAGFVSALKTAIEKWPPGLQNIFDLDLSSYYVLRAKHLIAWAYKTDGGVFKIAKDSRAKYEEAIADAQKALELRPQNEDALYEIGLAYYYLGENTKALHAIEGCLKLNPGHDAANKTLGWVTKELKKKK